jgi:hypothetical protein
MSFIQILEHEIHKKIWSMHEFHTHTPRPAPGDNLSVFISEVSQVPILFLT